MLPLFTVFALACARSPQSIGRAEGDGIIGGEKVSLEDRLASFTPQVIDAKGQCTGVLVEQNLVVTAAHCISSSRSKVVFKTTAASKTIGIAKMSCTYSGKEILQRYRKVDHLFGQVLKKNLSPQDFEAYGLQDFCALRLKEPAPSTSRPIAISVRPDISAGTLVTYVGWGLSGDKKGDFGILRKSQSALTALTKNFGFSESGIRKDKPCFGDSGGPAIVLNPAGEPELLGVTTGIYGDYWEKDLCSVYHYQALTRASAMTDFINAVRK